MHLLDLTLATPEENLALDEALLDEAEASSEPRETLRLWESPVPVVVIGRASQVQEEVQFDACRQRGIPVLRRTSGGSAIVAGPGSLMFAVVLRYDERPALRAIDRAHEFVLQTNRAALERLNCSVERRGTSDLAIGDRKVSGNSLRCKRRAFLYHGTLLYDFDLSLIEVCLKVPPRMPDYRDARGHREFVANLPLNAPEIRKALTESWQARETRSDFPRDQVARLVAERDSQSGWNHQR